MCLAVPGQIETIDREGDALAVTGRVNFGGAIRKVNLAMVPDAKIGDYVIVHVGMALCTLDEEEARRSLALFAEISQAEGP